MSARTSDLPEITPHAGTDGGLDSGLPFRSTLCRGPAGPLASYVSHELGLCCQCARPGQAAGTPGRVPAYGLLEQQPQQKCFSPRLPSFYRIGGQGRKLTFITLIHSFIHSLTQKPAPEWQASCWAGTCIVSLNPPNEHPSKVGT